MNHANFLASLAFLLFDELLQELNPLVKGFLFFRESILLFDELNGTVDGNYRDFAKFRQTFLEVLE